ncbi:MAG TPA: two-component regulator propeller domain-containing protein [Candidatus Acidoferrum sp.]|nr:two-component regulator propeller domain-containing protein [Candidatus Acidoferrum sp.]
MRTTSTIWRINALLNRHTLLGAIWIVCSFISRATIAETPPQTPAQFVTKAWSTSDGLPHMSVTALAQTRDGYIWVGTLAGLARFDGVSFKVFTPQNCPQLPKSRIGGLFEGADGTLFIATERGGGLVALCNGKFKQLLGAGNEEDGIVACLREHSGDSVFVAQSGTLWRWSGTNLTTISSNRTFYPILPRSVCQDEQGQIWMVSSAKEAGRLLRFSSGQLKIVPLEGTLTGAQVYALAKDTQGKIWLGTSRGLAVLRGSQFEPVELPELGSQVEIVDLAACRDGGLWICRTNYWQRKYKAGRWAGPASEILDVRTSLGILCEDRWGNLCLGRYPEGLVRVSEDGLVTRIDRQSGLPGATVACYLEDREGNEWLGLFDGGLVRLQLEHFNVLGGTTLTTPVYSICEDHEGSIWVGSSFGGIYRFQDTNTTRFGASDLPLTDIWSLFEDSQSNLWVGTSSYGVYQFRKGRFVSIFDQTQLSDRVNVIYEDHKSRIWFGYLNGLAYYESGTLTKTSMPWLSDEYEVVAITADRRNRLWVGTKGAGLFCLNNGRFTSYTTTNGLLSNLAWSLYVDSDDALWIGTADGGLSRLQNGKFENFTPADGLADNTICHIAEDSQRRLWFSSPHGIFYVEKGALESFASGETKSFSCTSYDQSDGMPSSACTCSFQPSGCITKDGRLLFPTLKGVVVVRPDKADANALPPPTAVEEVVVDGQVHNPSLPTYNQTEPPILIVPPGKGRLEIHYTALSFSAPEKVRFKYRMEGLDSDWIDGGTKRVADYSYLEHGRYRFQVQACNNDAVWNTRGASLDLIILPYFWQTWWFIGLVLLGAGAAIATTVRSIEKVKVRRRLERQEQAHAVELERARIARDFHDDLGACLSHMIVLSELVKVDKAQPHEIELHAAKIGSTARKAVQGLGTIVWAVNPRNDTLDSLVQYISQYAYDFFEASQIACHLDLPAEVPPIQLTAEIRHNLFMVVKEALNNILKHSRASEVHLCLALQDGVLEIRVEDNGCGFETTSTRASRRSGLTNMRQRTKMIGALLQIESQPGKGTSIRVRMNIPPNK